MRVATAAAAAAAATVASLVATSASAAAVANETWTPVVLMHGINGSPHDFDPMVANLQKAHPGQQIFPLDVFSHALSFLPIWHQIPHITDEVRKLTAGLDSYHLVCHSQGGIVCRALVETMSDHNVDNFVSLAGVQQGVRALPDSWAKFLPGWAQNLTDDDAYEILYSSLGQSISFGNYWRDPAPDARKKYLEFDALLPVLDNDPEVVAVPPTYALTPEERKSNFLKVKEVHLFASPDDTVVEPWDSPLFCTVNTSDKSGQSTVPMEQQPLYINDWFGLRTLDEQGRLNKTWLASVEHSMWLSRQDLFDQYLEPLMR